jgi:hypothetical protein
MPFDGNTVEFEDVVDAKVTRSSAEPIRHPMWPFAVATITAAGAFALVWSSPDRRTPKPVPTPVPAYQPMVAVGGGTLCASVDAHGIWSAVSCGGNPTSPRSGPVEAFAIEEDTYYDANGGIISRNRDVFGTGRTSCGDQDCPGSQAITSGNFANIMYTSGQQLSGGVVAIGEIDVRSLTVLGQQIDLPPHAQLTYDGNGNAVISLLHYDPQPTITWHGFKETFYDAAGFPLRSTTNVHFYNGEYCHPGYQSSAGAPAIGRMPNT